MCRYFPLAYDLLSPSSDRSNRIACSILNQLGGRQFSVSKWKKQSRFNVCWTDDRKTPIQSESISFEQISKHLMKNRKLLHEDLKIPPVQCKWLDSSVDLRSAMYSPATTLNHGALGLTVPTDLGAACPIRPSIDREGLVISSLQNHLARTVIRIRDDLVSKSDRMLIVDSTWVDDLLVFLSASVALVENVLHQAYFKAKYDAPAMGWRFDEEALGPTHGRRLKDKIRWISQITQKSLDDLGREIESFTRLKHVRNHMNHFDPPFLAMTIEDAATWLNYADDIAVLLWKLRENLGSPLSPPLIELLLLPRVAWKPFDPGKTRTPQPQTSGYATCQWPDPVSTFSQSPPADRLGP